MTENDDIPLFFLISNVSSFHSQRPVKIRRYRHSEFKIKQCQLTYLIIAQPVILQGSDIILACLLLAAVGKRKGVDVGFPDDKPLKRLGIRPVGKVKSLGGTAYETLPTS